MFEAFPRSRMPASIEKSLKLVVCLHMFETILIFFSFTINEEYYSNKTSLCVHLAPIAVVYLPLQ